MLHTLAHYQTALQERRRDFREYFLYSREGRSYAANSGRGSPVFYIDERLNWWSAAKLFRFGGFTSILERLSFAHLRETRRIKAYNRWINRHFEQAGKDIIYNDGSIRLKMPCKFPNASAVVVNDLREIYLENRYSNLLPHGDLVHDGDVVIDCGANIGAFAVLAATKASDVRVLAFEPEPVTYECLRDNVRLNGLDSQIECLRYGLAAEHGDHALLRRDDCFTMHRVSEGSVSYGHSRAAGDAQETVTCVALDEIVAERGLTRCNLIKMDIEGAEGSALRGASDTLRRFRPKLTVAAYHRPSDPFLLSVLIKDICPEYNIIVSGDSHLYAFV
jgi:FkbM family methyltransferase